PGFAVDYIEATKIVPLSIYFSLSTSAAPLALHPFPTRRSSDLFPRHRLAVGERLEDAAHHRFHRREHVLLGDEAHLQVELVELSDRKSTRLNSSHVKTSYAVFCLKKKIRLII